MTSSCGIGFESLQHQLIVPCSHSEICEECVLKLRLLSDVRHCPYCKCDWPRVVVLENQPKQATKTWDDVQKMMKSMKEVAGQGLFVDGKAKEVYKRLNRLASIYCTVCMQEEGAWKTFKSLNALLHHIRNVHDRVFCIVCAEHHTEFVERLPLFSKRELELHMKQGDPKRELPPHPRCEFCRQTFYGSDELYLHLERNHFSCSICPLDDQRPKYYESYDMLEVHFRREHFLCEEPECLEAKFIV